MESTMNQQDWKQVAEIELIYKTKVKASERPSIAEPKDAAILLKALWNEGKIDFVEQFKILLLNRANRVLGVVDISSGSAVGTIADPRLIFSAALKANAVSLILSHNHPSGNIKPSLADERLTLKIKEAGKYLDIKLLDHVIITSEGYYSFAEEGLL
jgi:DNA repair protein RadC